MICITEVYTDCGEISLAYSDKFPFLDLDKKFYKCISTALRITLFVFFVKKINVLLVKEMPL